MKMTIYIPDGLAARVKDELGDANISAICQDALRDELRRRKARADAFAEGGFERVEIYDNDRGRKVAFQGREVTPAEGIRMDLDVYVTPKGGVVISVPAAVSGGLQLYEDFNAFADSLDMERAESGGLLIAVADALGVEDYVLELDI